jgi:Carboxypeptidase regulatory-like domain/TonB-dependent Receptor Plug Domain/TonB dependent receptor
MKYSNRLEVCLKWLLVVFIFAITTVRLSAQQSGEITGTVTDSSNAVLPGATITTTNTDTQQARTVITNDTGSYSVPYLLPGTYDVRAEKAGFKLFTRTGIDVRVGDVVRIDFNMSVGAVSQQVQVSTSAPLLSTESTALGTVVGTKQVTDLPLNGRDYLTLVALSPNVEAEAQGGGGSGSSLEGGLRTTETISVAGQREEFNNYTLDGFENTDPNFNNYIIHPSIDAIQEFKVLTGVYSAEFGRGASQIDVTTRSGANAYHGTAFEFIRNDAVDAESWKQVGRKNAFRRNDYGFVLGGPVIIPKLFNGRNKLFFMSNFEGDHDRLTQQVNGSMPTTQMREGNFSGLPTIYEPNTRVYTSSSTGTATPFPNNQVPTQDITPQSLAILKYFPLPTYDVGNALLQPNGLGNYVRQAVTPTDQVQFNQRIDWVENAKSSWFGRFSWESDDDTTAPLVLTDTVEIPTVVRQALIENTHIFSSSIVNQARFGWDQFNNNYFGYFASVGDDVQATLGITGLVAPSSYAYGLPQMSLANGLSGTGGSTPYITRDDLFQGSDSLSIIRGNHTLTVGGSIGRDRYNQFGNQYGSGELAFDGQSTNNPGIGTSTGYSFADFLLGYPSQAIRTIALANAELRRTTFATFIQDDWKMTKKLTLNLGLRYEKENPWVDKHNDMVNPELIGGTGVATAPWAGFGSTPASMLLQGTANPILTRPGSGNFYQGVNFQFASVQACNEIGFCDSQQTQVGNEMGPGTVHPDNTNFGPRFGVNYSPDDKWNFRAGFGVYFIQDIGNSYFDMARSLGGKDQQIIANNARKNIIASPFAFESDANCPAEPMPEPCLTAPQIQDIDEFDRTPYVEQYMLNIQRQLTQSLVLEAGYMGSESHHLDRVILNNQAVPKSGPSDTSSILARTPFPAYGVFQTQASVGNAAYNSGSIRIEQRTARGLSLGAAYTWAKSIDDGSSVRGDGNGFFLPTNSYNLRAERGPSGFNVPQRFVANFLYQLPLGRGHSLLNHGIGDQILGGWQVGGILTLADGSPWNYTRQGDTADIGNPEGNEIDYTGVSPIPAHRSAAHFWNIASANYTNSDLTWRMGTMGVNTLTTPGHQDFDSSLTKNFKLWESHTLNFRLEVFNTLNHPNWVAPSSNVAAPTTFGVVTSAGDMRQLQGALKYSF